MTPPQMHDNEIHTDEDLVRRLLRAQFPQWADLPIAPPLKSGTSNAIFRLGDDLSVRLPRVDWATRQIIKDTTQVPTFAPHVPLQVPVPVAVGEPGEGYPFRWAVHPWVPGEQAAFERLNDPVRAARALAAFTTALQACDPSAATPAGAPGASVRGVPLADRDEQVRSCVDQLGDLVDRDRVLAAWEASLQAPVYDGPPVWVHGDISPGNLIALDGELTGVIDFGCLASGDPAADLLPAWNLFRGESREAMRLATGADDAMWLRGRGWGLYGAAVALPYYLDTNPWLVELSWHMLGEVLADADQR